MDMTILLLDVDGVLQFYDERLEAHFKSAFTWNTSHRDFLMELFADPEYPLAQTGEADFLKVIERILPGHVEVPDAEFYLDTWLKSEAQYNDALLDLLPKLPTAYLATNQDSYRGKLIAVHYAPHFEGAFVSYQMGVRKPAVAYFEYILEQLGVSPEQCTFVDDNQPNVDAGEAAGIRSILFQSNEQLFAEFESIGILSRNDGAFQPTSDQN
tara:strand:- start:160 stop:795 length:636 start_codon:yes stop_codon:yes gene_type:complete